MTRITALLAIAAGSHAANWPQFRGPSASGIGDGGTPLSWNGESGRNVLWKTAVPGLGYSSPVIWGSRVFLTSATPVSFGAAEVKLGLYGDIGSVQDEGAHRFEVHCVDRKSGKILWTRVAHEGAPKVKRHPKSSHANPTPATDGKRLIVSFGSEGLFAFDLDGKPLWRKDLGILDGGYFRVPSAQWGYASSPVLHDGVVLIQADVQQDSFLAAFDAGSGHELWRAPRRDVPVFSSPAVIPYTANGAKSLQVVVNGWRHIGGYDLKSGRELWKLAGGGDIPVPTPVYADGLVVITNAHGGARPVYAIRTDAVGEIAEGSRAIAWKQDRVGNYMQTPVLHGGVGYFCYDNGVLTALQLSTGERLFQQRLGGGNAGFSASPVAAGGRLYITSEAGHTFALELGREYKLAAESDLGEPVMASPAVADGVIYMRGRNHLFALANER